MKKGGIIHYTTRTATQSSEKSRLLFEVTLTTWTRRLPLVRSLLSDPDLPQVSLAPPNLDVASLVVGVEARHLISWHLISRYTRP